MDTQGAVDATPEAQLGRIGRAWARSPRFTATLIVGDSQGVAIEHGALKTSVRAHVLTDLFAHETCIAPGCDRIKQHPEQGPARHAECQDFSGEGADWFEVTDEGETRKQSNRAPGKVLRAFAQKLLNAPGPLVELHAGVAVPFEAAFNPEKNLGVNRLWTGVTAPETTGDRCEQEKGERAHDQQTCQVNKILRPQHHAKEIKLSGTQIEQDGLAAIPG